MKQLWHRVTSIGIHEHINQRDIKYVSFLNTIVLLAMFVIIGNLPLLLLHLPSTRTLFLLCILELIGTFFTLIWNYSQKYFVARIWFSLVGGCFLTSYAFIVGPEPKWQFTIIIIIWLEFYIFPPRQKRVMVLMILFNTGCFIEIEMWFLIHPAVTGFSSEFQMIVKYNNTFSFLFCAIAMGGVGYMTISRAENKLAMEYERSEHLLLNILPSSIAQRLKGEPLIIADGHADSTILFSDIVGFTTLSEQISPKELVSLLNGIFSRFDERVDEYGLEKIKTIGDAYMVAAGLPEYRADHAEVMAEMAFDMIKVISSFNTSMGQSLNIRIGINSGPVVAGVIGKKKFVYDLWGDSVNIAARMESHGLPGEIQVAEATCQLLKHKYLFEERGMIDVKGKGPMQTYLLKGRIRNT
ncbi:MAG: adenylate/guanylate cyclase domain-containing protein [Desulfobacterales bacterium]|nr:adenylate/guanylate cyclase domain-containing protein [Desulfobacterales bacterium]